MTRSTLMLMSQSPFDPASGAARSDRTVGEMLARAGFRVRCLATTATEQRRPEPFRRLMELEGITPNVLDGPRSPVGRTIYRFEHRGVDYTMLDTGSHDMFSWLSEHNDAYDALFDAMRHEVPPDIGFMYGGYPEERARRRRLRDSGASIVFTLHNLNYLDARAFDDIDEVIVPSTFVGARYRSVLGIRSTVMPVPLMESDVLAREHRPTFVTFVNPTPEKGVMLVARVAEEICRKRRDIPFMIVSARQTAAALVHAGLACGFDLRRHTQIVSSPGVAKPAIIYTATKILLVPSVCEETAGRVTAEAMLNGIPAIVSDRGGCAETSFGAAFVEPLPEALLADSSVPVSAEDARRWIDRIERLWDNPVEYAAAAARCAEAGSRYRESELIRRYADFFLSVRRREEHLIPGRSRSPIN